MPLKKIIFKPGVNRENTRYTTEGGFYESEKVRFRQGTPEVIGGWVRISVNTFLGVCRSLWNWVTLASLNLMGVGTNIKFYIENGGIYNDVTPLRTSALINNNPFALTGSTTVTVTDTAHGCETGDYVTFSGAADIGGGGTNVTAAVLNQEFQITKVDANTYTITLSVTPNATAIAGSPGGGAAVYALYQIPVGSSAAVPIVGWGSGGWGSGGWGTGVTSTTVIRLWNQTNYGEDLIFGPRGGNIYYWDATVGLTPSTFTVTIAAPGVITTSISLVNGTAIALYSTGSLPTGLVPGTVYYVVSSTGTTFSLASTAGGSPITTSGAQSGTHYISVRGIPLSSLAGASDAPILHNDVVVSDQSRFVLAFGTNPLGQTYLDPMLIRWSDQEDAANWTPSATNQAGDLRLSTGSEIITTLQTRQEVLVWTDAALYSLQYLGPPFVWGAQVLGDNISIISPNCAAIASGRVYWMGVDKFYVYDGRVQTLPCDLRRHVFSDINQSQWDQVFAGTNEGFTEVWWFYCSAESTTIDKYVIYNYGENIWYYGSMARTAWIDTGLRDYPYAATYLNNLVTHENGINDNASGTATPIEAYITSSEFDIDDGHNFAFIWRILPDLTFRGSSAASPTATMYLYPLQNSGSGYTTPASVAQSNYADIVRTAEVPIEQFTGQVYTRVRGRQLAFKIYSNQLDTTWQLGAPRFDIRPDGRR